MVFGARRHRGPGRGDPDAPAHVGGHRPPGGLHRPAGAVPGRVQAALSRGPPARGRGADGGDPTPADLPGVRRRAVRAAQLQPDVRDPHGPGAVRGLGDLPAPRDRPGHVRGLQERAPVHAQEAAVRHRPGGQELPQRDHARATSSSARASSSRWRWSSSSRPPRSTSGTSTGRSERFDWYTRLGVRPDKLRLREHDADELSHYSIGHRRRGVRVPVRLGRAGGHRQPRRLRPDPARRVLRREARLRRSRHRRPLRAARDRARRGRRPGHASRS